MGERKRRTDQARSRERKLVSDRKKVSMKKGWKVKWLRISHKRNEISKKKVSERKRGRKIRTRNRIIEERNKKERKEKEIG
jgi:hypothetical protein